MGEEFAGVSVDGTPIRCQAAFRILNEDEWTLETSDVVIDGQPQAGGAKLDTPDASTAPPQALVSS